MTACNTSKSPENHQVACLIEVYSVEEYTCLMALPERVLHQQEVFKRFLKTSRWSTYFVYVRPPKTRGFPEVFQRFLILGFWSTFFVYFRCYLFIMLFFEKYDIPYPLKLPKFSMRRKWSRRLTSFHT